MLLRDVIRQRIRAQGPLRFAEYMEMVLYHHSLGYYAGADQRSGRAGDFFTSVDVGSVFGELLALQFAEMAEILRRGHVQRRIDLVEAAAGNGRLSRDVLDALEGDESELYDAIALTLVERSAAARRNHRAVLGRHSGRYRSSASALPSHIVGIVFANELLDALPVHAITMTGRGLREVFIDIASSNGGLVERLGPPSLEVCQHVARFGIDLPVGTRGEVSPAAVRWVETAGRRIDRGFLVLVDYGYEAAELYSRTHGTGTLATYRRHVSRAAGDFAPGSTPWLEEPGTADLTAHVDLTAIRACATSVGLDPLAVVDQSYFLLGLVSATTMSVTEGIPALKRRLAMKSLLVPGGLGSTHKVLIFGKNVGSPQLQGCSVASRAT